jgi:hypothetical protein
MRIIRHARLIASTAAIVAAVATVLPNITAATAEASVKPLSAEAASSSPSTSVHRLNAGPWEVVNSPETYDSSPNRSYSNGVSVPSSVTLNCYFFGAPAGSYGNTLWYEVGSFTNDWINDHYLSTPGTAANPQPQTRHCPDTATTGVFIYGPSYTAVNSPVNWGNSPSLSWDVSSLTVNNGDTIDLSCYYFGAPTGPYGNTLWYYAYDQNNNTDGWINDHYLNTPGTAANPQPQTQHCIGEE